MDVELRLYLQDRAELDDLHEWLTGLSGVAVHAMTRPAQPNAQSGDLWDFLSVVCGAGGPVVAALRALQMWIEARTTSVEVVVGDKRIAVKGPDATAALAAVSETLEALGPGGSNDGDAA